MMLGENARIHIGANNPPEPTPFEAVEARINDLYDEAKQWLDGEPVTTQGMADGLNKLIGLIRDAEKEADDLRKAEAKPHDDAKAEIQARFNVLIGNTKTVKGKTVLALDAAKKALTPWLDKIEAEKRAAEAKARMEAEAARIKAEEAFRQSRADDLAAREEAERLATEAKEAERTAARASKDKASAKGGAGRATGLRTYYRAEVTDGTEFARYVWKNYREEMDEFLNGLAKRLVDINHDTPIPGVTIHIERKAV
jgi:hypothetical protein